jgi:hypothetical protein
MLVEGNGNTDARLANTSCASTAAPEPSLDALGYTDGINRLADVRQHHELVAADRASVLASGAPRAHAERLHPSSRRTVAANHGKAISGGRPPRSEAVVDVLEAIEVDEQHGEQVIRMPDGGWSARLRRSGSMRFGRRVSGSWMASCISRSWAALKARAHLVERVRRHSFCAATRRELERRVAAGNVGGRGRSLPGARSPP